MDLLRKTVYLLVAVVCVVESIGALQLGGSPRRTNGRQLVIGIRPKPVLVPVPNVMVRKNPAQPTIQRSLSSSTTNLKQTIIVAKTANLIHPDALKPSSPRRGGGTGMGGGGHRGGNRAPMNSRPNGLGAGRGNGQWGSPHGNGGGNGNGRRMNSGPMNIQNRRNPHNNNGGHGSMGHSNGHGGPRGNGMSQNGRNGGGAFNGNGNNGQWNGNGMGNGNGHGPFNGNGQGRGNGNSFRGQNSRFGGAGGNNNGNSGLNRNNGMGGHGGNRGLGNNRHSTNRNPPVPSGIVNAIAQMIGQAASMRNQQNINRANQQQGNQGRGQSSRPNGKMTISMGSRAGGAKIAIDTSAVQQGKKEATVLLVPKNAKPVLVKTKGAVKISRIRGTDGKSRFLIDPHPTAPGASNNSVAPSIKPTTLTPVTTEEPPEVELPEVEGPAAASQPV